MVTKEGKQQRTFTRMRKKEIAEANIWRTSKRKKKGKKHEQGVRRGGRRQERMR